jgi:hypothetical protein
LSAVVGSHAAHAAPPTPHWETVPGERQFKPAQQPAQDVASHTHALLKQRWPAPQEAPLPQRHPPEPQLLATVVLHETHWAPF